MTSVPIPLAMSIHKIFKVSLPSESLQDIFGSVSAENATSGYIWIVTQKGLAVYDMLDILNFANALIISRAKHAFDEILRLIATAGLWLALISF